MNFEWNKYMLTTKIIFDSWIEYILILEKTEKILISYKSSIKIFNIKTLKEEGEITFTGIDKFENIYLLKSGLISICSPKSIFLIELNNDNTYKIFQKIDLDDKTENENFKHLIELKNNNLCILSTQKIFIYIIDKNNNNYYKNEFTLNEDFFQFELAYNESCIELIYPEKKIDNRIAVYLPNVSLLSFWDFNEKKKINDTKNNYCNSYGCKDLFCLMEKGKYLLCACIDGDIHFYSTETCTLVKSLSDYYWHISVLKISENQILSGGDYGRIVLYEFNYEHELFKSEESDLTYLTINDTKKLEKITKIEKPKNIEEKKGIYGHGKCINEIRKFGETIISTSCYEENDRSFVCFWNKAKK